MMNLNTIKTLVQEDLQGINQLVEQQLCTNIDLIRELLGHIIHSGGKRLRPLIVLLTCHAVNYQGTAHITLAALIEFIHTATLLHDDVVDDSELRRGAETANNIWGNEASVLVGDFLFSRAFQMMVDLKNIDIMRILARVTNQLAEGEVIQLMNRHNPDVDEALYMQVIQSKTAMLFAAASQTACMLSEQSDDVIQAMYHYGFYLGTAFQLVDDALDYSGNIDQLGKNIGDDLAEGKTTLPLVHALRHANPEEKALIEESIVQGTLDSLALIQQTIASTGAIEYTYQVAKQQVQKALESLQVLPASEFRSALEYIANFAIERQH